jgi:probable rRNA maturation factor
MQEHSVIELYISTGDDQENVTVEQMLSSVNIDEIVVRTLQMVGIGQQVMLTLLITDNDGIRDMNKQYRNISKPTDVLSFPLLEKPLVEAPADQLWPPQELDDPASASAFVSPPGDVLNLGDIVMAWPAIVEQAKDAGHSALYELLYLLCHGVLHLVGYDDQTESGYQAMVSIQEQALQAIGQKA